MPQSKRAGDDDLTESSRKNTRTDTDTRGGDGDFHQEANSKEPIDDFGDSCRSVRSELSEEVATKFSRIVVSIALSDGHEVLFACSGIAFHSGPHITRVLTSESLVRAFNDKNRREGHGCLNIEVRRNGDVARGILGSYRLDKGIAVVNIVSVTLGVHPVDLRHQKELLPCSKVVAVARADSGTVMATTGILAGDSSGSEDGKELMLSTCKISEAWEGGPLFDCDGNFVGMNLFLAGEGTSFVPRSIIIKRLEKYMPKREVKTFSNAVIQKRLQPWPYRTYPRANLLYYLHGCVRFEDIDRSGDLDSWSYPKPSATTISEGLRLVNTFEETFGDLYDSGKGAWSQLSKEVCQKLSRLVVSLASYIGEKRVFACTGLFIEWDGSIIILTSASLVRDPNDQNKIAERLKIVVCLANKQRKEGILQCSSLYYNVALVSVKDFRHLRSFRTLEDRWSDSLLQDPNVVAVGRCFESGVLMATCGSGTDWSGLLDCRDLRYSSCKITKAGIGGPLVDFSGRFIGMNFYDKKMGTPFMFRDSIIRLLDRFKEKRTVDEFGSDGTPIRWPVPVPCWRHRDDEVEDSEPPGHKKKSGKFGFTYMHGVKIDYH